MYVKEGQKNTITTILSLLFNHCIQEYSKEILDVHIGDRSRNIINESSDV